LPISFISPMARRPDALFATNIASLIFLPDLRFLALTSFQSLNRPSLSSGSSSRISLLKQSFSVSRPRLRPPGNIQRWSRLLLTNNTRPRLLQRVSMTLPLRFRTASTPNRQCKFYSIPCTKKGNDLSRGPVGRVRSRSSRRFGRAPAVSGLAPDSRRVDERRISSVKPNTERHYSHRTGHWPSDNQNSPPFLPSAFMGSPIERIRRAPCRAIDNGQLSLVRQQ
jgi:hypothetical protein